MWWFVRVEFVSIADQYDQRDWGPLGSQEAAEDLLQRLAVRTEVIKCEIFKRNKGPETSVA